MSPTRKLLLWWAVSWTLAGVALAYELSVFDHAAWITHTPHWPTSYLPSPYEYPALTTFLSLFGAWWSFEAPFSAQPILLFCLLCAVAIRRLSSKRPAAISDDRNGQP